MVRLFHTRRQWILVPLLTLTLSACGAGNSPDTGGTAASPTTAASQNPTATTAAQEQPTTAANNGGGIDITPDGGATINLTIEGGPHAGSYEASAEETTCSKGLAGGNNSWGNQYSIDTEDPKTFSSLQLIVDDAGDAADGTQDFMTTVSFGSILNPSGTYTIKSGEARGNEGSGTVTINDTGSSATVQIEGETPDGVKINATIECEAVFRVTGGSDSSEEQGPESTITAELTGALEGSYSVTSDQVACGYGPESGSVLTEGLDNPEDAFTVEFFDEESGDLTGLELLIPSTEEAASGTKTFYLNINDQTIYIENLSGEGDFGTVTVDRQGETATVTVDATADDGTGVQMTIDCGAVQG